MKERKDNIELEKNFLNEDSNKTRRNKKKPINPIYGHIYRTCGIIIILAYWINAYINHKETSNVKINAAPKIQAHDYFKDKRQPEKFYQPKTNYLSNKNNTAQPASPKAYPGTTNQSNNNFKTQKISLSGKVFSWTDEHGLRHYSNTNYPQDNPTLKIQDEIKTQY